MKDDDELRDWFAGMALTAFIRGEPDRAVWSGTEQFVAERSYAFADAMMSARKREGAE